MALINWEFPATAKIVRLAGLGIGFAVLAMVMIRQMSPVAEAASMPRSANPNTAIMSCTQLGEQDFLAIAGAATTILSTELSGPAKGREEQCIVRGYIQPQIQFEMRLPTNTWNGSYFQTGCGGFCGKIPIAGCMDALAQNFAVAANNMGHVGNPLEDPLWGGSSQLREDYGQRSTYVMSVVGKEILKRYYGKDPQFSYFKGCSTGGREGLFLALHHPDAFDGIVAGDPAFPALQGGIMNNWIAHHLNEESGVPVFDNKDLAFLNARVLETCDAYDGLRDGILEDPRDCDFDLGSIPVCNNDAEKSCLTPKQILAARRLYDGPTDSEGQRLYPGYVVFGSEKSWNAKMNEQFSSGFLRYLAFEKNPSADYSYRKFDFDKDISKLEKMARLYNPVAPFSDPDLSAFRQRGGKLIVYHGWADGTVSPLTSVDFYVEVAQKEGGYDKVREWYRLFMLPGMHHCRGGAVPDKVDWLSEIVAWVEKGEAPDKVIANQYATDARTADKRPRVIRSRPVYPYPEVARYKGKGDIDRADSWDGVKKKARHEDDIKWIWDAF